MLVKLNRHYHDTNLESPSTAFNSLRVTSLLGRSAKVPITLQGDEEVTDALVLLHLGRERAVNIIPKRFNNDLMDVFDLCLGNLTALSVLEKTRRDMSISLAIEKPLEDELDFHLLVQLQRKRHRTPIGPQQAPDNTHCSPLTDAVQGIIGLASNVPAPEQLHCEGDNGSLPDSQDKQDDTTIAEKQLRFFSRDTCDKILNSASSKNLNKWIDLCGLTSQKTNERSQTAIKAFFNLVIDNKYSTYPSAPLITSLVEKMAVDSLDRELKRFEINFNPQTPVDNKKKLLRDHVNTIGREARKANPPDLINSETDSESISSELSNASSRKGYKSCNSNNSSSNSAQGKTQNTEKKVKVKVKKTRKARQIFTPGKIKVPCSTHESIENSIRLLEQSLLEFQEKLANQDSVLSSLASQLNSSAPLTSSKSLATLVNKNKTIFDTLNIQQNSIDNIMDRMIEGEKERKRIQDQAHRATAEKVFRSKTLELEKQIADSAKEVNYLKSELARIENNELNQSKEIRIIQARHSEELSKLKSDIMGMKSVPGSHSNGVNYPNQYDGVDDKCAILSHLESLNRRATNELGDKILQGQREGFELISRELTACLKDLPKINTAGQEGNVQPANKPRANSFEPEHQNDAANKTPEDPLTRPNDKKRAAPHKGQKDHMPSQKAEDPVTFLSEGTTKSTTTAGANKQSKNNSDGTPVNRETYRRDNFNPQHWHTRKCVVIHDAHFNTFDESRFTKRFDVKRIEYDTAVSASRDQNLVKRVSEINPEAIYIHLGQLDVLKKTPGNTILDGMKKILDDLTKATSAKICVSQIIPLPGYPQVSSTIRQINSELSEYVKSKNNASLDIKLCTQNNDNLGGFIQRSVGPQGVLLGLDERGARKLWLHLRDGLFRSLDIELSRGTKNPIKPQQKKNHNG